MAPFCSFVGSHRAAHMDTGLDQRFLQCVEHLVAEDVAFANALNRSGGVAKDNEPNFV